jgi:hypothetical protein
MKRETNSRFRPGLHMTDAGTHMKRNASKYEALILSTIALVSSRFRSHFTATNVRSLESVPIAAGRTRAAPVSPVGLSGRRSLIPHGTKPEKN